MDRMNRSNSLRYVLSLLVISSWFALTTPAMAEMRLGFAVPGIVAEVLVKSGQPVKKGTPLARLDTRPFDAKVRAARAALDAAELELGFANDNKKRVKQLFDDLSTSAEELERASLRVAEASAKKEEASANFRIASWELERATLTAPASGSVGSVPGYSGLVVDPSRENTTIVVLK